MIDKSVKITWSLEFVIRFCFRVRSVARVRIRFGLG